MSKPINENLRELRIENEDGDLIPVLDHAGAEFAALIKAVVSTGKAGAITTVAAEPVRELKTVSA